MPRTCTGSELPLARIFDCGPLPMTGRAINLRTCFMEAWRRRKRLNGLPVKVQGNAKVLLFELSSRSEGLCVSRLRSGLLKARRNLFVPPAVSGVHTLPGLRHVRPGIGQSLKIPRSMGIITRSQFRVGQFKQCLFVFSCVQADRFAQRADCLLRTLQLLISESEQKPGSG